MFWSTGERAFLPKLLLFDPGWVRDRRMPIPMRTGNPSRKSWPGGALLQRAKSVGVPDHLLRQDFVGVHPALGAETLQHLPRLGLELTVFNVHPNTGYLNLVNVICGAAQFYRTGPGKFSIRISCDRQRKHLMVIHNHLVKRSSCSCSQKASSFRPIIHSAAKRWAEA